jgi:acetyl esterase/lipase
VNPPAHLDPETVPVLGALPVLDLNDVPTARANRAALAAELRAAIPANPAVARLDEEIPGDPPVRVRRYRPADRDPYEPLPCLVWVHGGGHVLGEVDQDDPTLDHLTATFGLTVVSVDWRRAPEHPFPAEVDDAYAALLWAAKQDGVDPNFIAVGGASSGGGTAAGLALLARDRADVPVHYQLLIYPMLDDRTTSPAHAWLDETNLWHHGKNALAWQAYLGDATPVSPYAAPARAEDLRGLPPAFIATGDLDLFAEEDATYAARLIAAGVPTELHVYPGGVHGFDLFVPEGRLAGQLRQDRDRALAAALPFRNTYAQRLERSPRQV